LNAAAFQSFTQNRLLESELRFVACVLIVAAPASAKVWAGWDNALRRGDDDFVGIGRVIPAIALPYAHANLFAGQRERDKDGFAFHAGKECAAVYRLDDLNELSRLGLRARWFGVCGFAAAGLRELGLAWLHCWLI
jgi:hypothetical protein